MTPSVTEFRKFLIVNSPWRFKIQLSLIKALRRSVIKKNYFNFGLAFPKLS